MAETITTLDATLVYRDSERERRRSLLRRLLPALLVLQCLTSLMMLSGLFVFATAPTLLAGTATLVALSGVLCSVLAYRRLRHTGINSVVTFTIAGLALTIVSLNLMLYNPAVGLFGALTLIALATMLTLNTTAIIVTALATNVVFGLLPILVDPAAFSNQSLGYAFAASTTQWICAILLILTARSFNEIITAYSRERFENLRARKLDDLKDQFISSVNHEIRNPVMAMLGYLELLRVTSRRATPERRDEIIYEATQAGIELRELLASILSARRLDQGVRDFTPEAVDVNETLEAAMRLIDPQLGQMAERPLNLHVLKGLEVWGDKVRLQQVLTNLLSNAIKYSPAGTPIEFRAQVAGVERALIGRWGRKTMVEDRVVEIVVRDSGLGIPPDQIPLLFQKFVRLERDLASTVIGNGLGLYLCRTFVEAMGGRIWVESSGVEGEGSAFHVQLPMPPHETSIFGQKTEQSLHAVPVMAPVASLDPK